MLRTTASQPRGEERREKTRLKEVTFTKLNATEGLPKANKTYIKEMLRHSVLSLAVCAKITKNKREGQEGGPDD
ncbi:unnamed protein product [Darwinula stevensoni]|uniref:Uncharacterized protein n=1 Tax=Darwinula stevensoni TaxID=69355 RepID=A0A7R9AG72_9CRUS|nr:unnamed protein product [Darwinula stevensoni]CAG0903547.1 unnamed protein product [Darwinula stevensoni]